MPTFLRKLFGAELAAINFGYFVVLAAAALSAIGLYLIDLSTHPAPSGGAWVTLEGESLRQAIFMIVGVLGGILVVLPHHRYMRVLAVPAILLTLALLVLVLIPAVPVSLVRPQNGARSWITVAGYNLQPSELGKIAYVLVMALYLRSRPQPDRFRSLIIPGIMTLIPVALIIKQPDLGTACLFIPSLGAMLIAAGARLTHLGLIVLAAALAAPIAYPHLESHQKRRIEGLLQVYRGETQGRDDITFQYFSAMTVAGSGQMTGMSDAKTRSIVRYNALPEAHTDMIFAVLCARFGLVGAAVVLGLYALWLGAAACTAALCHDAFGRIAIVGCCAIIAAQVFINIGMNIGLVPIIGITLPFLSAGGSSLLTLWIMTGLVVSFAIRPGRADVRIRG